LLQDVWIAVRANLRAVLEQVTIADLVDGKLPEAVMQLTRDDEAWVSH
jgi:DNA-binding IscR family transcriptional regulator